MPNDLVQGEEWIYRRRDDSASERVIIERISGTSKLARVDIRFMDRDAVENVPAKRLRAPWVDLDSYEALMRNLDRLADVEVLDAEGGAAAEMFFLFVDREVAEFDLKPVSETLSIHDVETLDALCAGEASAALDDTYWLSHRGTTHLSRSGTVRVAAAIARVHTARVLEWIDSEESASRVKCAQHEPRAHWEWEWYIEHERPVHELLREWCGYRAVNDHERLRAAEAEVRRLDGIVAELLNLARTPGDVQNIERIETRYRLERVSAARVRNRVERPLSISEMPVRHTPPSGRGWS